MSFLCIISTCVSVLCAVVVAHVVYLIMKLYVFCRYLMMIIDFQLTCAQATAEPAILNSSENESITISATMETRIEAASTEETTSLLASTLCSQFPSYYSNYSVLILIATAVITQLSHVCKICLMAIIAGMND